MTVTPIGGGMTLVRDGDTPMYITVRVSRSAMPTMRTFHVRGYGSYRGTVQVAEMWREVAISDGVAAADEAIGRKAKEVDTRRAAKAVGVIRALEAAREDVDGVMRRYKPIDPPARIRVNYT